MLTLTLLVLIGFNKAMRNQYFYYSILTTLAALVVLVVSPLYAVEEGSASDTRQSIRQEYQEKRKELLDDRKAAMTENRCSQITTRLNRRIERYDTNRDRHLERYAHIAEKLRALMARWTEHKCDTSEIQADLQTLDTMIKDFTSAYSAFNNELETSHNLICGDGSGDFKTALKSSHEQLALVRKAGADIRNFYKRTVRLHLNELRTQCRADKTTDEEEAL